MKKKDLFFFFFFSYKTHTPIHTKTHAHHAFILSLQGFVTVRTRNQYRLSEGDASIVFTEALFNMCTTSALIAWMWVLHIWNMSALFTLVLWACVFQTLWLTGVVELLTLLFLVCQYTPCQSLLWRCRSTLVCAFIGFGQQMACHGWCCVQFGNMHAWLYVYPML